MPGKRVRRQPLADGFDSTDTNHSAVTDDSMRKRRRGSQLNNAKSQRCPDSNGEKSRTWTEGCSQSTACICNDPSCSSDVVAGKQQASDDMPTAAVGQRLPATFFDQPTVDLAHNLLGKYIVRISPEDGSRLSGRIVETEAYVGLEDRASHSYGGRRTARNEAMYMPPGASYVYNIYGIYTCINISSRGDGTAVLIRALEPTEGLDVMKKNRAFGDKADKMKPHELCNGPSKLTKALSIVKSNGDQVDLATCSYLWLEDGDQVADSDIVACSRIGIGNYAMEWTSKPLRFYIRGCRCVSVRCRAAEDAVH